ncbi:MAG TPA: fatty acid desaturase [Chitinophagaceae bacterium]|nr:fatty acid desaturase [Chitinophagaceae bacterium]
MAFIDEVLQVPAYGWKNNQGELIKPTRTQLFREFFSRMNIIKSKKNWISFIGWFMIICMLPFSYFFIVHYFSWVLLIILVLYSMIIMGTHGTIWFHRYCTHRSFKFRFKIWRFITQNLVIKTIPEEIYVVSHHVHHVKSDEPGDPYNARGGFLYCMLADVNHQGINKSLSEKDYRKASHFMKHTGVKLNSYKGYKKWGSLATPGYTIALWLGNWTFWYIILFLIGGHGLACALFTAAMMWFLLVRAFNYTGHGGGENKHVEGLDFDRSNLSINQWRPGYFAGEWHNNHHLYPGSARAGFLPWQLDIPWIYIYVLFKLGAVSSFHDSKNEFMQKHFNAKKNLTENPHSDGKLIRKKH